MRRREFISLFAGAAFPSEQRRYPDPATELEVLRLTDPEHSAFLPRHGASRRGNFLLYASDRGGSWQAYRMDLKTGESRAVTEAADLDPATLTLLPDDRSFVFCDGDTMRLGQLGGRVRDIGTLTGPAGELAVSEDGQFCSFVSGTHVNLATLGAKPSIATLCEAPEPVSFTQIRPRRTQVLYLRKDGAPWLVNFTGQGNRPLKLEPVPGARSSTIDWTPGGRTLVYLRGSEMREHTPDENSDRTLAKTSQFAGFGMNGDSSVFVGASGSKASAYVLLLLRVTRREFTLCEHGAKDAASVRPVFTPNSQSVLFQSDRHGKPSIYRMRVEKLVDSTDSDTNGLFNQ